MKYYEKLLDDVKHPCVIHKCNAVRVDCPLAPPTWITHGFYQLVKYLHTLARKAIMQLDHTYYGPEPGLRVPSFGISIHRPRTWGVCDYLSFVH